MILMGIGLFVMLVGNPLLGALLIVAGLFGDRR